MVKYNYKNWFFEEMSGVCLRGKEFRTRYLGDDVKEEELPPIQGNRLTISEDINSIYVFLYSHFVGGSEVPI